MPLFRCDKCGCVENTACGHYWTRNQDWWPEEYRGKALCSECGPPRFADGTPTAFGKWHGLFPKRSAAGMLIDQHGHLWSREQVDAGHLSKHYQIVGQVPD